MLDKIGYSLEGLRSIEIMHDSWKTLEGFEDYDIASTMLVLHPAQLYWLKEMTNPESDVSKQTIFAFRPSTLATTAVVHDIATQPRHQIPAVEGDGHGSKSGVVGRGRRKAQRPFPFFLDRRAPRHRKAPFDVHSTGWRIACSLDPLFKANHSSSSSRG